MKKFTLISCVICSIILIGCGDPNLSESNPDNSEVKSLTTLSVVNTTEETEAITELSTTEPEASTQNNTDPILPTREYIESYNIYAEKGAVIKKMNSETGEFSWSAKCESCGKIVSGVGNSYAHLRSGKLTGSFTCSNPQCSTWGKNQDYVICCEVSGEWVDKN